ncbi:thioredoxin family protein [Advenella mandrilli]
MMISQSATEKKYLGSCLRCFLCLPAFFRLLLIMLIQNPSQHASTIVNKLHNPNVWLIACYCAQWCDTCKEYFNAFTELSHRFPQHLFVWVDIEEEPDLLDDIDIENFPTLLIQIEGKNHFFGTLLPYISHLERILQNIRPDSPAQPNGPASFSRLIQQT